MYIKSDTFLLADVLKNFRKMIYKLDPSKFFSPPGLT